MLLTVAHVWTQANLSFPWAMLEQPSATGEACDWISESSLPAAQFGRPGPTGSELSDLIERGSKLLATRVSFDVPPPPLTQFSGRLQICKPGEVLVWGHGPTGQRFSLRIGGDDDDVPLPA